MGDLFNDLMHLSNSREIRRNQNQIENVGYMQQIQQRVDYLEKKYDVELPNYYEYTQQNPVPAAQAINKNAILIASVAGAVIGAVTQQEKLGGLVAGGLAGATFGLVLGGEDQALLNKEHMQSYVGFLNAQEQLLKQLPQPKVNDVEHKSRLTVEEKIQLLG